MPITSVAALLRSRTLPSGLKIISAAGTVSIVASRSACAASTRRRDSAVTAAISRESLSAVASSRSRLCTASAMEAKELNSTPISSPRSVWCAAEKSPRPIRSADSVSRFIGSSSPRLAPTINIVMVNIPKVATPVIATAPVAMCCRCAFLRESIGLALACLEAGEQLGDRAEARLASRIITSRSAADSKAGWSDVPGGRPRLDACADTVEQVALLGFPRPERPAGPRTIERSGGRSRVPRSACPTR